MCVRGMVHELRFTTCVVWCLVVVCGRLCAFVWSCLWCVCGCGLLLSFGDGVVVMCFHGMLFVGLGCYVRLCVYVWPLLALC